MFINGSNCLNDSFFTGTLINSIRRGVMKPIPKANRLALINRIIQQCSPNMFMVDSNCESSIYCPSPVIFLYIIAQLHWSFINNYIFINFHACNFFVIITKLY